MSEETKTEETDVTELFKGVTPPAPEKPLTQEEIDYNKWIDGVNAEAQQKASELSALLNAIIEPFVFVIDPMKDAAVGYVKKPNAKESFKLFRLIAEDIETAVELAARAQLVREYNGMQASDPRFMDANGNYALENSDLNFALLLKVNRSFKILKDQFKKK